MPSKPRYLLTLPFTMLMLNELQQPMPNERMIERCLKVGADPYAKLPNGNSVFREIALRAPHPSTLESWFQAVGSLADWSWQNPGLPNPLEDLLPWQGVTAQPEGFTFKYHQRLHAAGFDLIPFDTPEKPLLDRVFANMIHPAGMIEWLVKAYPEHRFVMYSDTKEKMEDHSLPKDLVDHFWPTWQRNSSTAAAAAAPRRKF